MTQAVELSLKPTEEREPVPKIERPLAPPDGHGLYVAHHKDYALTRVLGRDRSKRDHLFAELESFAAWMNKHASPETSEILVDQEWIGAALDAADPNADNVRCTLTKHPSFAAWQAVFGKPLDQKAFHRLLRANAESLGDQAPALLGELRSLKVVTGGDYQSDIDERGYMRVHGSTATQQISVKLPPEIVVRLPIFEGVRHVDHSTELEVVYDLTLMVEIDMDTVDGVIFMVSCPELELRMRAARRDAVAFVKSLLNPMFLVGVGKLMLLTVPDTRTTAAK